MSDIVDPEFRPFAPGDLVRLGDGWAARYGEEAIVIEANLHFDSVGGPIVNYRACSQSCGGFAWISHEDMTLIETARLDKLVQWNQERGAKAEARRRILASHEALRAAFSQWERDNGKPPPIGTTLVAQPKGGEQEQWRHVAQGSWRNMAYTEDEYQEAVRRQEARRALEEAEANGD